MPWTYQHNDKNNLAAISTWNCSIFEENHNKLFKIGFLKCNLPTCLKCGMNWHRDVRQNNNLDNSDLHAKCKARTQCEAVVRPPWILGNANNNNNSQNNSFNDNNKNKKPNKGNDRGKHNENRTPYNQLWPRPTCSHLAFYSCGGGVHDGAWETRDRGICSRGACIHAIGYSNRLAYAVQPPHNVVSPPYGSGAINFTMLRLVSELRQPYVVMQPALWGSYPGRKICVSYVWLRCRRHTRSPPKHPKQIINNKNGAAPLCVCANIPQKTLQKRGETIAIFFLGQIAFKK